MEYSPFHYNNGWLRSKTNFGYPKTLFFGYPCPLMSFRDREYCLQKSLKNRDRRIENKIGCFPLWREGEMVKNIERKIIFHKLLLECRYSRDNIFNSLVLLLAAPSKLIFQVVAAVFFIFPRNSFSSLFALSN